MVDMAPEDTRARLRQRIREKRQSRNGGTASTGDGASASAQREKALMECCGDNAALLSTAHSILTQGGLGKLRGLMRQPQGEAPPPESGDEEAPPEVTYA